MIEMIAQFRNKSDRIFGMLHGIAVRLSIIVLLELIPDSFLFCCARHCVATELLIN